MSQIEIESKSSHSPSTNSEVQGRWVKLPEKYLRDPTLILILVAYAIIIQLFYTTDFRKSLENFFFDIRIKWMPPTTTTPNVFVIKIDDDSIERLTKDPLRLRIDGQRRPYLPTALLTKATSILANTEARAIALLMPENAFPATDIDLNELTLIGKYDKRIVFGTVGYNQTQPNLAKLPPAFSTIADQVAGYETFRSRSNAIVRTLPFTSYRGLSEVETLPAKIAEVADSDFTALYGWFTLKFSKPESFPSVSIADFLESPLQWMPQVKNKIVVVGYTAPRDTGFQTTDQMMVNTPLTGFSPTLTNGISTTWLMANAIDNLVSRETLQPAPEALNLVQTIGFAALCGALWQWGSLIASLATIFCWLLIIAIHAALYRWFSLSIPLADTFLATTLVTLLAAIRTVRLEIISMAEQTAETDIKSQIASVQSHFLTGFASWLKSMTANITQNLQKSLANSERPRGTAGLPSEAPNELYQRAFAAAEDFHEYLEGINQLPELETLQDRAIVKEDVPLRIFLNTILRRFNFKLESRSIKLTLDISDDTDTLKTSPQLLDAILFNLISNAVKYGPTGGKITIRSYRSSRKEVSISVTDEGPGIPEELSDRIFERFYRIRDDRMYQAKGTGLGLFLCKYFAEHLGGRILLESDGKSGSTFTLVVPA
jgi:signal transduction histidine kinase